MFITNIDTGILVGVLVLLTALLVPVHKYTHTYNYKLKKIVFSGRFVSSDFVLNNWMFIKCVYWIPEVVVIELSEERKKNSYDEAGNGNTCWK